MESKIDHSHKNCSKRICDFKDLVNSFTGNIAFEGFGNYDLEKEQKFKKRVRTHFKTVTSYVIDLQA